MASGDNCVFPPHDEPGSFRLELDDSLATSLLRSSLSAEMATPSQSQSGPELQVIVFGDNDPTDCKLRVIGGGTLTLEIDVAEVSGVIENAN
mgnify:CR=1 FL=1